MKSKIDITTIIGLLVALMGIGTGYFLEGGDFKALVKLSPILIIFGGTFGVVITTLPLTRLKQLPKIMKALFTDKEYDHMKLIDDICEWAKISQRKGIVALDNIKDEVGDEFIANGIDLVVSNIDPESVREFLENELDMMEDRHNANAKIFSAAGGFAPTMGIIGTVLGLVIILAGLEGSSIGELGHGIATAFLATFMGVASANIIFLPFDAKLKAKSAEEKLYKEIALQGIIGIQEQESYIILRKRLLSLLPNYVKNRKEE